MTVGAAAAPGHIRPAFAWLGVWSTIHNLWEARSVHTALSSACLQRNTTEQCLQACALQFFDLLPDWPVPELLCVRDSTEVCVGFENRYMPVLFPSIFPGMVPSGPIYVY